MTREKDIYRVTILGSIVNFLLLIFKFVAGVLGSSAAMIADAVHSLSDFITDVIVIIFVRISNKPADIAYTYGHGKFETLATTIIATILFVVGGGIFINGVRDIITVYNGGTLQAPGTIAFVAAAVSIIFKEAIYRYTIYKGQKLNSQAVIANAWHHRSDAFSSIGTLLGIGGAIIGGEQWRVLDPIAAIVVSVFICKVAVKIFRTSIQELLEHSLPYDLEEEIRTIILSVEGVSAPHHLRTRRIGSRYAIEVHIRMNGEMTLNEAHQITSVVEKRIKERFGEFTHVGIHTEPVKGK
ncbi:MAG: cation transporter [Bacteroidales bacterium]|nr:cation transporter [Bacteroidales bacterium]